MADISQLLANAAQTNADFDLGKINKSYWEGQDQYAKNQLRDAFKDGVPTDANGQPDFGAMAKVLFQKGGLNEGVAASNLDISRQQLKAGQDLAGKLGQLEGGTPPPSQPIVGPSTSRNSVAIDPSKRADISAGPSSQPSGPQGGNATLGQILTAQGIPNDQIGAASASLARQLGLDNPNAPIDVNNPQVRNVLVPAIQQLKRMGIGQVVQQKPQTAQAVPQQPQPPQQAQAVPPQAPQQAAQPNPQQNQGTFGAPSAVATRGAIPTGTDPEIQKQIAIYTSVASNPAYPKSVQEAALTRLKALQDQGQPTPDIKNYDLYRRQGGNLPFNEWQADTEQRKAVAGKEAESSIKKYDAMVEGGVKAQQEIPQLEMLQEQMNDPNFYSGIGEKYSLAYKRLKSAVGIDPDASVPQEFLRKATAASVLGSFGALKGLGPIRVAEMNLAKEAAAAPTNSIPANKLLVEIQKRTYQRQGDIAEMAQNYKEKNGILDATFDKQVTAYFKAHPIFTDAEVKDFHKAIGEAPKGSSAPAQQRFSSPSDVHAAVAAGQLKSGDSFVDPTGKTRYVP
jgi:hypothetical protein